MRPYDRIPPPSRVAEESAVSKYKYILRRAPKVVKDFDAGFYAWQKTWHTGPGKFSSRARDRCNVPEYDGLLRMGPKIIPLVVYKLLDHHKFTAVYLYNDLEQDTSYKIDPRDVLNFFVLQRQSNLVIDVNQGR